MSCQKGNVQRSRPQKHQNSRAFKNDLHEKTPKMKMINNIEVTEVCSRCKDIIEWKIKYKKYKLLAAPKKCTKCEEKTVLFAYHVLCSQCSQKLGVCAKCSKPQTNVNSPELSLHQQQTNEFELVVKFLPERKRRTLARFNHKGGTSVKFSTSSSARRCDDSITEELNDLCLSLSENYV